MVDNRYQNAIESLLYDIKLTLELDSEGASIDLQVSIVLLKLIYLDNTICKSWISSYFMQSCTKVSE